MKFAEKFGIKHTGDGDKFQTRVEKARVSKSSTDVSTGKTVPTGKGDNQVTPNNRTKLYDGL